MAKEAPFPWDELLPAVRRDFPELYRAWFEQLEPGELRGGELAVTVADPSRAAYLRSAAHAFVHCAMAITGRLIPVRFISPADPALPPPHGEPPPGPTPSPLNPDYTFEQFVVGPSNRLAHAACRAICATPGTLYNPLFIHGPSGLGKTHLLQAVCVQHGDSSPPRGVLYVSCETFVNDFVRAIAAGWLQEFRDCARSAAMLVIDDVQFLANRESSQEELFHTFNALHQDRRQIVLSADKPPSEIPTLEERLVSRFNWGLVTQIDPPNREERQAILQKKAELRGVDIPAEVLDLIAERVAGNIRLLEGALTRLISETQINNRTLNLETAREILLGLDGQQARLLRIADILDVVTKHFGVRTSDLLGRKRSRSVSQPRQIGMYLARKLTSLSLEEIGSHFGGRDHSTVLHADRVVEEERKCSSRTAETLALLTRQLLSRR